MRKAIFLLLISCSANADMYSCADESGKKILRNYPCEQNEKQQPIINKVKPSYYIINSTGERQGIASYQTKQTQKTDTHKNANHQPNGLRHSIEDRAFAFADKLGGSPGDSAYDSHVQTALRVLSANVNSTPQTLEDRAFAFADKLGGKPGDAAYDSHVQNALRTLSGHDAQTTGAVNETTNTYPSGAAFSTPQPMTIEPEFQQIPSVITNCDSGGCWDNLGNRYNGGGGDTYFGPSGACQMVGNMMHCN